MRRVARHRLVAARRVVALVVLGTGAGDDDGGDYQVRAIFENAFSVIPGEDVKIAGVKVGKIESLDVTPDQKAAVVLRIDRAGFDDFRRDAECTIRPQSLIGEKFVECTPTQPRPEGAQAAAAAAQDRATARARASTCCRSTQTSQAGRPRPDQQHHCGCPTAQRLSIILNELGTGAGGPRRRPAPGDPQRRPGAARRPTRSSQHPRRPEPRRSPTWRATPTRSSRRWRATARRSPTSSRRRTTSRQATAERRGDLEQNIRQAAGLPARAAPDDGRASAASPTR